MSVWRFGEKKTDRLCAGFVAALASLVGVVIAARIPNPIPVDFFAMWSFARFALTHEAVQIYQYSILHSFQLQLDAGLTSALPFAYPPTFLLVLLPFGLPPLTMAWCLWTGLGFGAYVCAVCAGRWRGPEVLLLVLAPATVAAVVCGQNGLFSAAAKIGGVRLMRTHPVLAGVLFGLMSLKPQMALLLPVALVAGRMWRCLLVASLTAIGCAALSILTLGWSVWPAWITALSAQWGSHVVEPEHRYVLLPTVAAGMRLIGLGNACAQALQGVSALIAASLVWLCFRRSAGPLAVSALLVGGFLATPYAFPYDMPALTFAVILLLRDLVAREDGLRTYEVVAVCLGLLTPYDLVAEWFVPVPLGAVSLAVLFAVIVRRCLAQGRDRREHHFGFAATPVQTGVPRREPIL